MTDRSATYLIWSNEHGMWWRPAQCGYTRIIGEAGRYDLCEARLICVNSNAFVEDGEHPHEVAVPEPLLEFPMTDDQPAMPPPSPDPGP